MSELELARSSGDAAWNRLADGVTAYLLTTDIELGDGDALIVESREKDTAVGGVGAYVQFRPEDGGALRAEIIGDEFLPSHRRMGADAAAALVNEGWSSGDSSNSNWWRIESAKDLAAVHAVVSRALWVLRHEFGVASPVEVECEAFGEAFDRARAGQVSAPSHDGRFPDMLGNFEAFLCEHLGCPGRAGVAAAGSPPALPAPRLVKSAPEAEKYAAKVMESLGFTAVRTTRAGADGGIDVTSHEGLAQVKMEGIRTGRPILQAIYGLASLAGKEALVFSLAGYTQQAREWAQTARVALFEFRYDGSLEGQSAFAQELLKRGLRRHPETRAPAGQSAGPTPPVVDQALVSQLQALAELYRGGALTVAEYAAAKAKLLS